MMRFVLIGLGMVAKTHVNAIAAAKAAGCELYGVMSRSKDSAEAFLSTVDSVNTADVKIFEDIEIVASDPNVDAVALCTPPNARLNFVKTLAKAGKPILMEKPVERTAKAARELVDVCEEHDVPLGIFFQHRMRDVSLRLAEMLEGGALGAIRIVEIAVPWWREQSYYDEPGRGTYARDGGGVLISQAIHTLDLALTYTGPVVKVQAMARTTAFHQMESEDYVTAGVEFASGAIGSIVASTASYPGDAESIVLHCEKGSATLKSGVLTIAWQSGETEVIGETAATGGGADPMAFTHEWHQAIFQDFAAAVKQGRKPVASGRDALAVHDLIEAITISSKEERAVTLRPTEN